MSLDFADYLTAIRAASDAMLADVREVGLDAPVPTAPEWTTAELLTHQGRVHRWATKNVAAAQLSPADFGPAPEFDGEAAHLNWFAEGADDLVRALENAPEDLVAFTFLADAPPARLFWARRQAHETTIHRVDALGARLGRMPTASKTGIPVELALDGIDELLTGFLPRRSSTLRTDEPTTASVVPLDAEAAWTLRLSGNPPVTSRDADPDADALLSGGAVALYLGLWNRGDEIAQSGGPDVLGLWRENVRIG